MKSYFLCLTLASVLVSAPIIYPKDIVKCPDTLSIWMKQTLTYQKDGENGHWKTPEKTVQDKGGDCEDFAILAKYVLKDLGYKAWVVHGDILNENRTRIDNTTSHNWVQVGVWIEATNGKIIPIEDYYLYDFWEYEND